MSGHTPSQTIGPFFAPALVMRPSNRLQPVLDDRVQFGAATSQPIQIVGCVRDGDGEPITDALIETFQVNSIGAVEAGLGMARTGTENGEYRVHTVKPGPRSPTLAPCIEFVLFMRGLLNHLFTRLYFGDEQTLNAEDAFLAGIPERLRDRLVAHDEGSGLYRFDIFMQGDRETPFIDR